MTQIQSAGLIDGPFFHHRNQVEPGPSVEARSFPFQNQTAHEAHQNSRPGTDMPLFPYQGNISQSNQIPTPGPAAAQLPVVSYQNQVAQEAQLHQSTLSDLSVFHYQNQDVQNRQQTHNTVGLPIYHYQNQAAQGAEFNQPALIIAKAPIIGFEKDEPLLKRQNMGKFQNNLYHQNCGAADTRSHLHHKPILETRFSFGSVATQVSLSQSALLSKSQALNDLAASAAANAHKEDKKYEPNEFPVVKDAVTAPQVMNEFKSKQIKNGEGAEIEAQLRCCSVLSADGYRGNVEVDAILDDKGKEEPYASHENILMASIKSPDINMNETEKKDKGKHNGTIPPAPIEKPQFLEENSLEPFVYYEDIVATEVNSHEFDIFLEIEPHNRCAKPDAGHYIHRDDEFAAGLYYEKSSSPSLSSGSSESVTQTELHNGKLEKQQQQSEEDKSIAVILASNAHLLPRPPDILSSLPSNVSHDNDNIAAMKSIHPDQELPPDGSEESVLELAVLFEEAVNYGLPLTPPATPQSSPPLLTPPCVTPPRCMSPHLSSASSSPCFSTPPFSSPMSTSPRTESLAHWELLKAAGLDNGMSSRQKEHSMELPSEIVSQSESHSERNPQKKLPEHMKCHLKVNVGVSSSEGVTEVNSPPQPLHCSSPQLSGACTALPTEQKLTSEAPTEFTALQPDHLSSTSISNGTSKISLCSPQEETVPNATQDISAAYPFQELSIQIESHLVVNSTCLLCDSGHTQSVDQSDASPGLVGVRAIDEGNALPSIECNCASSIEGEAVLHFEDIIDASESSTDSCFSSHPTILVSGEHDKAAEAAALSTSILSLHHQDVQSAPVPDKANSLLGLNP